MQQKSRELNRALYFDEVTGLPNRLSALNHLARLLETDTEGEITVIVLDLDNFKLVNDSLGSRSGDAILRCLAQRLRCGQQEGSMWVARLGDDEFCLILPNLERNGLSATIESVLKQIKKPIDLDGQRIIISASAGAAVHPRHGDQAELLLCHADAALRRARKAGGDGYRIYHPKYSEDCNRLTLIAELQRALENREFILYLQPKFSLERESIVGAEALLRWRHPQRGLVQPADFIPALESSGLIVPVGEWIMEEACRLIRRLRPLAPHLHIAVNLSARQLRHPRLVSVLEHLATKHGLSPEAYPELEITESMLMEEDNGPALVRQLHEAGFKIALDDFGTGYSSLSYLARLPVDALKIDRSFVRQIGRRKCDETIARLIAELGKALGLQVIAEGVETADQMAFLCRIGCHQVQGYFLSPPVDEPAFRRLLADKASCPRLQNRQSP